MVEQIIQSLQEGLSSKPCVCCGSTHSVVLRYVNGVIFIDYPEGACEVFQTAVKEHIKRDFEKVNVPVTVIR